jgi:hypothetical protein
MPAATIARKAIIAEGGTTQRSTIAGRTRSVILCQVGRTHIVALALRPEDGMKALEIEGQTDQTPLARGGLLSAASENWRKPSTSLMMPITGSTVHLRAP